MNKYLKNTLGILILLIPTVILLGFLLKTLTKKSFYPVEGTEKVEGLNSNVKIYSDDYGIPHIIAANENDMYFAMGYMHARDRLWQMDLTRRVAEGRLSEIFGSVTLDYDKLFRTIGINKFSFKLYTFISPKSRDILQAYSNGVNKFIESHQSQLPVEFDALNYKPEPWKPEESLMVSRLMGWELNVGWYAEYVMGELVNKFGPEKLSEIFPDTNIVVYKKPKLEEADSLKTKPLTGAIEPNDDYYKNISVLGKNYFDYAQSFRKFFNIDCSGMGSNSWVISGQKCESGKPLLANDPHIAFSAPSKWYEVHLKSASYDAIGMSIPGAPGIVIGHNRIISWGETNLMNDDIDFYVLDKDSVDDSKYKYKNQTFKIDSTVEKIPVKDSGEVEFTVKTAQIGPVVSELNKLSLVEFGNKENYTNKLLTFRWTGFESSDEISSIYKINTSKNWEEFKNALKDYGVPALNFTYADTMGNIGYYAAGKIPIRKSSNVNEYVYPIHGDNDWTGFVDFDKMPNTYNPKEGFIVTANTNPFEWLKTEPKNKFYISYYWESSSRFDRIKEMLQSTSKLNLAESKIIQMNYISPYAREILKYINETYKNEPVPSIRTKSIIEKFKTWNGDLEPGQSIGSVYSVFLCFLFKNIYRDKMGEDIFRDYLTVGNFPYRSTLLLLRANNPESYWLPKKNDIIKKSLEESIKFLEEKFNNPDPESWHWGEIHRVVFRHPLGSVPALENTFNIGPFEAGGDQTTVNASEYNFYSAITNGDFSDWLGPSMRMVVDMSDISHTLFVNTTGQSGQPLHPNYSDQTRLWLYGDYTESVTNEIEMLDKKYNLLTLEPLR